jgi:UDP-glucose 4-epimerase
MKRVLVTGVAGFLGSHLADKFLEMNLDVIGIDNLIGGYRENVSEKVRFHEVDLGNLNLISPYFKNVDLVVHSACTAYEGLSVFSPGLVAQNTSQITTNVLSASAQAGVKKFVFMSSMARYGTQKEIPFREEMIPKPQDPYGIAKLASELMVRNICETHGMEYVILVPHNIIGPRQKYDDPYRNVASIMINRVIQKKPPIIYGDGSQLRCFSFIQDVVNPIIHACLHSDANNEVVNIGPDEEFITINDLAKKILHIMNFRIDPIYVEARPQEVHQATCSANRARKLLNYKTLTSLDSGLEELVNWISDQPRRDFSYHLPIEIISKKTPKTWTEHLI